MSMLDLFRRAKPVSASCPSLDRAASCTSLTVSPCSYSAPNDLWSESKTTLKRCSTNVAHPTAKRGWGIVPVLNELERRSSSNTLLLRRSPSAKQVLCLNCRRLYFPGNSQCTSKSSPSESTSPIGSSPASVPPSEQFCSLDCKSSYACQASMQDLVDLQLHGASTTSSDGDDGAVITLDDDTDFSF